MSAPHRIVDGLFDGFLGGVGGAVSTVTGSTKQVGEQIMGALDQPVRELTGRQGPHRMIDNILDGGVDAFNNAVVNGGIGSIRTVGEGIARALDNPVDEIGVPPKDVGNIGPLMK